jgi:hypothetical protein
MRRGRTAFVAISAGVAAVASCQDPTELTLHVTTSAKCADFGGTAIAVGPDVGVTESHFDQGFVRATTPATRCDSSGLIGTLVVTPGGGGGSVLVAAAVRGHDGTLLSPLECADMKNATSDSCIIARRSFTFSNHHALVLPIDLDPRCAGVSCTPGNTCYRGGCVDESVACDGDSCGLVAQGFGQGGGTDASTSDGVYEDGSEDGMALAETGVGSDATMNDTGTDVTSSVDASDAGAVTGTSRPPCTNVMQTGMTWTGICSVEAGHGQFETSHSMFMTMQCTCQCLAPAAGDVGALQCGSLMTPMCTGMCGGDF